MNIWLGTLAPEVRSWNIYDEVHRAYGLRKSEAFRRELSGIIDIDKKITSRIQGNGWEGIY